MMELIKKLIPAAIKQNVKSRLLAALSAEPEIVSRIATRVVSTGVPNYLNWNYEEEKRSALGYVEQRQVGKYEYTFSASSSKPTLYASIYACMLKGLYKQLAEMPEAQKNEWLQYLDSFQTESDGLFRDAAVAGDEFESDGVWGDGWGIRHLAGHIIIAYARLGRPPCFQFRFLEPYYDDAVLNNWLDKFDFSKGVWPLSNYIMNLYTLLQYARDFMGEDRAARAVKRIGDWLAEKQRPETGMWHDYEINGYPELGDAIRGAYHFYPLFVYEGREIQHREKVIEWILKSQNSWGGFEQEKRPSGACEDIDAIEPLIRFALQTGHRKKAVDLSVKRSFIWNLANRNDDGGYEFLIENGCHYGLHPEMSSKPCESNLFATWFRTLNLAYMTDYLKISNSYNLGKFPGYEIAMQ